MKNTRITCIVLFLIIALSFCPRGRSAGILTPVGASEQPIQILDHLVDIVIHDGFAQTTVTQRFFNPNDRDLEAVFSLPLPQEASLAEMTIWAGESELNGEVMAKAEADRIYEEEKSKGNDAGKAAKNGIQSFDFHVSPVRAQAETRVRFVYYQPLKIDTGVGRYVYPLEPGGTDEMANQFWLPNTRVEGTFTLTVEIKSAVPITQVRTPGFEGAAIRSQADEGRTHRLKIEQSAPRLERDFVLYYRLQDDLPGSVELTAYRPDPTKPGTFMMTITPAVDLGPLTHGADYIYVLDQSGSMSGGKIQTLASGVAQAIGGMRPQDRFRIVTFNDHARELTGWLPATPEHVQRALAQVKALQAQGSTNLYDGLQLALQKLDADRATSIVLVTDGVTNAGILEPRQFHQLLANYDARIFGFLMGNSANWPLMNLLADTTGGFAASVSNDDDIVGQILLAKDKITHECLHDAKVQITGVRTADITDRFIDKVYRGQQLVIFGRYDQPGRAQVQLKAKLTGADRIYQTTFDFPATATDAPEIERLWALATIHQAERMRDVGLLPADEAAGLARSLGVQYQIVTDETSMVVLADEVFAQRGIERRNQARVAVERQAQAGRAQAPATNRRVDQSQPMFTGNRPRVGGGGAVDAACLLLLAPLAWAGRRAMRRRMAA